MDGQEIDRLQEVLGGPAEILGARGSAAKLRYLRSVDFRVESAERWEVT